jgi:cell division control protein 24
MSQKDKKDKKDKDKTKKDKGAKGNKLQLKGRIFMTNVTDVVSLVKPGRQTHHVISNLF